VLDNCADLYGLQIAATADGFGETPDMTSSDNIFDAAALHLTAGTGAANTTAIVDALGTSSYAAGLCYDLPVYRDVYTLILRIFELTKDFPREYKYTPGQDIYRCTNQG
jgi:hypothetical protein